MIHIVLHSPKMPSNTGNIIRLCANTGAQLHLIEPLGFTMDDKKLRRAGLDYHEYAQLCIHADWAAAKTALAEQGCTHVVALTTKLSRDFYGYDFTGVSSTATSVAMTVNEANTSLPTTSLNISTGSQVSSQVASQVSSVANSVAGSVALVFGSETAGLPEAVRADIGAERWLRLPMLPTSRSLNLSNSVAICLYEVWRQLGFNGDEGQSVGYQQKPSQQEI